MDLEPYALTHTISVSSAPSSPSDKGKGKAAEEGQEGDAVKGAEPLPTIEDDVKHLVQGVSSWWTGFSQKSQAQFTQAQQHIASQGGIVSFAKKEASRIEAQLEETRRRAKDKRETEEIEERKKRSEELDKQRLLHEEEQAAQQPTDASSTRPTASSRSRGATTDATEAREPIFDAEEVSASSQNAVGQASTSTASLFPLDNAILSRLQTLSSDPRVASIQHDLASRLSSSFSLLSSTFNPAQDSTSDTSSKEGGSTTAVVTLSSTLQDISSSLSKISGPEAKAYAQKYLKASEELMGKMGEEVKTVVGDLIKVVPPLEAGSKEGSNEGSATTATPAQARPRGKQPSEVSSSEFSSWDLADSEKAMAIAGDGKEAAGPYPYALSTASAGQSPADAGQEINASNATGKPVSEAPEVAVPWDATHGKKEIHDSGEDSDWD